jgi:hypothetical protein
MNVNLTYNKGLQKKRCFRSPKKQTQFKPNLVRRRRIPKGQNRLPENLATPHVFMKLHWNWTADYSIIMTYEQR